MTIKEYLKNHDYTDFFDNESYEYPEPIEDETLQNIIIKAVKIHYGGLKMRDDVVEDNEELKDSVYTMIWDNEDIVTSVSKIFEFLALTPDDPSKVIEKVYGQRLKTDQYGATQLTTQIGARSSTDTLGATHEAIQNTGTSYASTTGKNTTGTVTDTNAITNGSSSTAATDTQSTLQHSDTHTDTTWTDTESIFDNVSEDNAADIIPKWKALLKYPIMRAIEKIIVEAVAIPYFE